MFLLSYLYFKAAVLREFLKQTLSFGLQAAAVVNAFIHLHV